MSKVFEIYQFGKKDPPCCPHCASTFVIRYGSYPRAHPKENLEIAVQRYLCKSPDCPWKTFSRLPYPFMPIVRHFYQTLLLCHFLVNERGNSQAATARKLGMDRGIVKRLGIFCRRFIPWLNHEKEVAEWGLASQDDFAASWPDFTRDFSQAFYPQRWPAPVPT